MKCPDSFILSVVHQVMLVQSGSTLSDLTTNIDLLVSMKKIAASALDRLSTEFYMLRSSNGCRTVFRCLRHQVFVVLPLAFVSHAHHVTLCLIFGPSIATRAASL